MALHFIDSFDHYRTAQILSKWTNGLTLVPAIAIGEGRCNTNALQVGNNTGVTKGIPFGSATGIMGFACRIDIQAFNNSIISEFGNADGPHLYLKRSIDGSLRVERVSGVDLGSTAPDVVREDVWAYIEWKATINNVAGSVVVRVNGATVLSLAGVDTQGDLNPAPTLSYVSVRGAASQIWFVDDVYVADDQGSAPQNDFLGDIRVEYLHPDGAGASQQWDLFGAPDHNTALFDGDSPDNDLTYIHTASSGFTDTETYTNTGLPSGAIFGVQVDLYARKTDSGLRSIAPIVRHGGADFVGANVNPGFSTYNYLMQVYMLNPGTGVPWTISDVNNAQFGVRLTL